MTTLKMDPTHISDEVLDKVCAVLMGGGIIVYPTETVYGIGADIFNESAVQKVYSAKGRDFSKPLSIALSDISEIEKYAHIENEKQREFIRTKLPGPYTVILRKKEIIPDWIAKETVGIRVPEYYGIRKLIQQFGPITATSANPSGKPAPVRAEDVSIAADLILDGGETIYKKASTVFDLTQLAVLRA